MSEQGHPQTAGFTPRYVWRGRERCIVWQCCGQDARQGRREETTGYRDEPDGTRVRCVQNVSFCECDKCGRTISQEAASNA